MPNPAKRLPISLLSALLLAAGPAAAFEISFDWSGLTLCTGGRPNTVQNPPFTLKDVPLGTKFISFRMKDINFPSYPHGGGIVEYTGQSVIEPGAFTYQSPCPSSRSNTYEWTAIALTAVDGDELDKARARRQYPEY